MTIKSSQTSATNVTFNMIGSDSDLTSLLARVIATNTVGDSAKMELKIVLSEPETPEPPTEPV